MALFALIALQNTNEAVDRAVQTFYPNDSYKIETGKWIVSAGDVSTARELGTKLGLRETNSHLVFAIRGYSGRAQPDLWEWLAAQSEKANA
jgi:hypothetical protein